MRTVQMCCGYPDGLDNPDYPKAPKESYGRIAAATDHIESARLIAAPDCGLGILGRDLALKKSKNLGAAAHSVG